MTDRLNMKGVPEKPDMVIVLESACTTLSQT